MYTRPLHRRPAPPYVLLEIQPSLFTRALVDDTETVAEQLLTWRIRGQVQEKRKRGWVDITALLVPQTMKLVRFKAMSEFRILRRD